MDFVKFRDAFAKHFKQMTKEKNILFTVSVDKDKLWDHYLKSFPEDSNPIYRVRKEHDCSCCRHFIKSVGNIVSIENGKVESVWDFEIDNPAYQIVTNAMAAYVKSKPIENVFITTFPKYGVKTTFENKDGKTTQFDHFEIAVPKAQLHSRSESLDTALGRYRDTKNVFKRSLDELTEESVSTVLELIQQNSLYKGEEWKKVLLNFTNYKKKYDKLEDKQKELFAWENFLNAGEVVGRIRNHSMGTLLIDISAGMELDMAVRRYEAIVAPTNYKRPKAIFTQRMLDEAKKTITDLGYLDSLSRRYAKLDDITVNNILFSNKDSAKRIVGGNDIFSSMEKETKINPKKFSKIEELSIDKFVKDVLPTAIEIEAYVENKHAANLVSLIAPEKKDSPTMFKWNNGFSWAYSGNMTDSLLKERVKAAGGNVTGDFRFSIQWNDGKEYDENDLDAHCVEPGGNEIYFRSKYSHQTGGTLDVDIIHPSRNIPAVENITWASRKTMKPGTYKFFVHQYCNRGGRGGFRAEVEFDGQIYSFDYPRELRQNEKIQVAEVVLNRAGGFELIEKLPSNVSSREFWGITTNQFIPVSVIMYSPNYWDEQQGIGHRHYFFMLKDCVNPEEPNGFYNEFLRQEFDKHKRVLEALGAKAKVSFLEDQLSGLGFSSTKRSELVVKVKGQTERILKVLF